MKLDHGACVALERLMTGRFGIDADETLPVCFKIRDFNAENLFGDCREPVYLKGQLPPISLVGAIKDLGKE